MRNWLLAIMAAVAIMAATPALATMPGYGGPGNYAGTGPGNGCWWGDPSYILKGEPFSFTGAVKSVGYYSRSGGGGGMVLAAEQGDVTVYGTGPYWYWQRIDASWPQVGDQITVQGFTVDLNGVVSNMAMSITTADGSTVQLRDPQTGVPLWW